MRNLAKTATAGFTVWFRWWPQMWWPEKERETKQRNKLTYDICAYHQRWNTFIGVKSGFKIVQATLKNTVLSKGQCANVTNKTNKHIHITSSCLLSWGEVVKCLVNKLKPSCLCMVIPLTVSRFASGKSEECHSSPWGARMLAQQLLNRHPLLD